MKTYLASFSVALYSTRPPAVATFHVCRWFFPGFFARRSALNYGKRRNWILVSIRPIP